MKAAEERVRGLFTSIASVYDAMNRIMSLGLDCVWRRRALACLDRTPRDILDVACGTGDLTLLLARRYPLARVTGVDLTPAMLERARKKRANRAARASDGEASRVVFHEGDAQTLDGFPSCSFDLVTCAFGFRNFPDAARALAAARRVLRPGGTLLVLEFFRADRGTWSWWASAWTAVPAFLFASRARAAYRHLRQSMRTTHAAGDFLSMAGQMGFACVVRRHFFPCCTCFRLEKQLCI